MKKSIVVLLVLLCFFGCSQKKNNGSKVEIGVKVKDTSDLTKPRKNLLRLNKLVEEKLQNLSEFEQVKEHIDTINIASIYKLENSFSTLNDDVNDLYKALPSEFKNNQVLSRLNQLRTYALLSDSNLNSNKKDSLVIENSINSTLDAYDSLIVQFNETENRISEDFKKELEKAKFERDSLKQNEVAPLF